MQGPEERETLREITRDNRFRNVSTPLKIHFVLRLWKREGQLSEGFSLLFQQLNVPFGLCTQQEVASQKRRWLLRKQPGEEGKMFFPPKQTAPDVFKNM